MVLMKSFYELEEYALVKDVPIMQKEGIEYLIDELNKRNAESVLEIGSAIGYSSLMMVTHVKGLHVDTIERDDTRYQEAVVNIKDFHQEDNITIYHEDALEFDDTMLNHAPYDCLFIDAAKAQYQRFFEKYVPYLKEDGFVLVDNLDFHGMIFDIPNIKNRNTRALVRKIKRFKDWIFSNDEYDAHYVQVGDGLCIITRKDHNENRN